MNALILVAALLTASQASSLTPQAAATSWRQDPAWHAGKAEWALYDAKRPIYGVDRRYEATIFTNKQRMDPATTTKAARSGDTGTFEVFKHNVSEMIPTENYTYRFLTTSFVRVDSLETYKVAASTQEDCGATYRQLVVDDGVVAARSFCYFPGAGEDEAEYDAPDDLAFHDTLTLTLRDYPFDDPKDLSIELVPDQTDLHRTRLQPRPAQVRYGGRETIEVPYGAVETHLLTVVHERDGGTTSSGYWFAADPSMRHVLVQYRGPHGAHYELKRLEWWAYWAEPRP